VKISGDMYKFQDLTPISGHFRTNFKISGQRPGLSQSEHIHTVPYIVNKSEVQDESEIEEMWPSYQRSSWTGLVC